MKTLYCILVGVRIFKIQDSLIIIMLVCYASQCGVFDIVTDFSVLSNPADAQNVSCLGLCSRDICPKSYALYGLGTFNSQLLLYNK